jgi:hypothetical protein
MVVWWSCCVLVLNCLQPAVAVCVLVKSYPTPLLLLLLWAGTMLLNTLLPLVLCCCCGLLVTKSYSRSAVDLSPFHDIDPRPRSTCDGAVVAVLRKHQDAASTSQPHRLADAAAELWCVCRGGYGMACKLCLDTTRNNCFQSNMQVLLVSTCWPVSWLLQIDAPTGPLVPTAAGLAQPQPAAACKHVAPFKEAADRL